MKEIEIKYKVLVTKTYDSPLDGKPIREVITSEDKAAKKNAASAAEVIAEVRKNEESRSVKKGEKVEVNIEAVSERQI